MIIMYLLNGSRKKVKNLLIIKDRNPHKSCQIYEGICSCGENHVGETIRNVEIRWSEHENTKLSLEPARHLLNNPSHTFTWKTLLKAPKNYRDRKIWSVHLFP